MTDEQRDQNEHDDQPRVFDKRRIDPETGEVRAGQVRGVGGQEAEGEQSPSAPGPAHEARSADASADERAAEQVLGEEPSGAEWGEPAAEPASDSDGVFSDDELEKLLSGEGADEAPVEDEATRGSGRPASPEAQLAEERLQDLLRIQAEYANYRRRTDRERAEAKDRTTADVLATLLPVLDDLDLADKHGDLVEGSPLAVIGGKLRGIIERHGVTPFGEAGEAFDPNRHEAIAQLPNPAVERETIADVVQRGYEHGERVVRVAKVAVFVPAQ